MHSYPLLMPATTSNLTSLAHLITSTSKGCKVIIKLKLPFQKKQLGRGGGGRKHTPSEEPKYSVFTEQLKHKGIGHPLVVVDSGVPYS